MIRKLIAITLAVLINAAMLACFHAWSTAAVASVAPSSRADKILTLPVITVHPSAAQMRALRRARAPEQAKVLGNDAGFVMPFYSFAARQPVTAKG